MELIKRIAKKIINDKNSVKNTNIFLRNISGWNIMTGKQIAQMSYDVCFPRHREKQLFLIKDFGFEGYKTIWIDKNENKLYLSYSSQKPAYQTWLAYEVSDEYLMDNYGVTSEMIEMLKQNIYNHSYEMMASDETVTPEALQKRFPWSLMTGRILSAIYSPYNFPHNTYHQLFLVRDKDLDGIDLVWVGQHDKELYISHGSDSPLLLPGYEYRVSKEYLEDEYKINGAAIDKLYENNRKYSRTAEAA